MLIRSGQAGNVRADDGDDEGRHICGQMGRIRQYGKRACEVPANDFYHEEGEAQATRGFQLPQNFLATLLVGVGLGIFGRGRLLCILVVVVRVAMVILVLILVSMGIVIVGVLVLKRQKMKNIFMDIVRTNTSDHGSQKLDRAETRTHRMTVAVGMIVAHGF